MDHRISVWETKKSMDHRISVWETKKSMDHRISVWETKKGRAAKKRLGLLNVAIRTTMGLSRLGLVSANQPEQGNNSTSTDARNR